MTKIGLTTLYDYNYGSALQCFATQYFLEQNYCDVDVICDMPCKSAIWGKARTCLDLGLLCLCNMRSVSSIIEQKMARRGESITLSATSLSAIKHFINTELNRRCFDYRKLKQMGLSDEYKYFFSGSDQVWNGSMIDNYNRYFLRFVSNEKKVAWAPSFGGTEIAPWNKRKFKHYVSEYKELSAREKSGAELIEALTKRKATVLPDPVMLLTADQWRSLYSVRTEGVVEKNFILAFFIDKPSEDALNKLIQLQNKSGARIISFGYSYNELKTISNAVHMDGGPFDFIKMIDKAALVMTDSYHACVFSLLMGTHFYVFSRNYQHKQNQGVRIASLLEEVEMPGLFNPENCQTNDIKEKYINAEAYFYDMRVKAESYLSGKLGLQKKNQGKIFIADKSICCGCGACEGICHVNAIKMEADNNGFIYPTIDMDKCIECGICGTVCEAINSHTDSSVQDKQAYVAYADDTIENHSASGGIFSAIAREIIRSGGIVYGAAIIKTENGLECRHILAENESELTLLQGSKYVQSNTSQVFFQIRNYLAKGKKVLFSGTSCQVAALRKYLRKDYDNLFLIDLICHGVPSGELLTDYIHFIENKYHMVINDISFRTKGKDKRGHRQAPYVFTFTGEKKGEIVSKKIALRESAYYRMFMSRVGYRKKCYSCKYASIDKPADITLGDWYGECSDRYYSTVIVHDKKGMNLLDSASCIVKHSMDLNKCIEAHEQLQHPSKPTRQGEILWALYKQYGFERVQAYINRKNIIYFLPNRIRGILKK